MERPSKNPPRVEPNRLAAELADICRLHPIEEKWVLAPNLRIGHQWLDAAAVSGQPVFNARVKTLTQLALELAAPLMRREGLKLLRGAAEELLAARVLSLFREQAGEAGYLGGLRPTAGYIRALLATLRDLRLSGVTPTDIAAARLETERKSEELSLMLELYERSLEESSSLDKAGLLSLAARRLREEPPVLPRGLLMLAPADLFEGWSPSERSLWEAFPEESRRLLEVDRPGHISDGGSGRPADARLLSFLPDPTAAPPPPKDGSVRIFRTIGEINEVREALRLCLEEGIPFDRLELLYTDPRTYIPLIYETAQSLIKEEGDPVPLTFAEGIPVSYSRPARALAGLISWIREDFPQGALVDLVNDGLLRLEGLEGEHSFSRLAAMLRPLTIGWGRERYIPAFDRAVMELKESIRLLSEEAEGEDPEVLERRLASLDERMKTLEKLRAAVFSLLASIPEKDRGKGLLEAARDFLSVWARRTDAFDEYAAQRLSKAIEEYLSSLNDGDIPPGLDALSLLEEMVLSLRVMGMGPRPGCVFVQHYLAGGHSGRPYTFILGLDDSRHPGSGIQDPLLLDRERSSLSSELPTAAGRLTKAGMELAELFARLRGRVAMSYSCYDLQEDREMFPSTAVLDSWRIISGDREATVVQLDAHLGPPASFAPASSSRCLRPGEWWTWRACEEPYAAGFEWELPAFYPHLGRGLRALQERNSDRFTVYDGYVPEAGAAANLFQPDGIILSHRSLETLARCPMDFFFRYILGLEPPDEYQPDPFRWLDPMERGLLLHEAFRDFLEESARSEGEPDLRSQRALMKKVIDKGVRLWEKAVPPLNPEAFESARRELHRSGLLFLELQRELSPESRPAFWEVSLGLPSSSEPTALDAPEPVSIALGKGRSIRLRGRMDRVDRLRENPLSMFVWDYKTGGDKGFRKVGADPFNQGRIMQPFLYAVMLEERLRSIKDKGAVAGAGFLLVSETAQKNIYRWSAERLRSGREKLGLLCSMIELGCFPLSNDPEDVKYSDYAYIHGDPDAAAALAVGKLKNKANKAMAPFRELREVE